MTTPSQPIDSKPLKIRRGRVVSVDLYEVKDSELDLLEKGSPAETKFNFALTFLSLSLSCIGTLCTTETFKWPIVKSIYVNISIVGLLLGIYLMFTWWQSRESISDVVKAIKCRMEPTAPEGSEGTPADPTQSPSQPKSNEPAG
jgi:hypothetical protein